MRPVEALLSRLGVGSDEAQALFGQSVEVGGPDPAVTVSAEVVPPAAFYEHDVGSVRVSPQARQGRRVSDSDKPFMRHLYDGVGCLGQPICRTGADGAPFEGLEVFLGTEPSCLKPVQERRGHGRRIP